MTRARLFAALLTVSCAGAPQAAPPAPAAAPQKDQRCIDDCVRKNQMKATSIERIESECEDECSAGVDQPR